MYRGLGCRVRELGVEIFSPTQMEHRNPQKEIPVTIRIPQGEATIDER